MNFDLTVLTAVALSEIGYELCLGTHMKVAQI